MNSKRVSIRAIREQYAVVRRAFNELYGPLSVLEEECLILDDMLNVHVEGEEGENPRESDASTDEKS